MEIRWLGEVELDIGQSPESIPKGEIGGKCQGSFVENALNRIDWPPVILIEGGELQDPLHSHPFSTLPCCPKPGSRPYHQATPLDETQGKAQHRLGA